MKIALVVDAVLPVLDYGGTERVVWGLGKALAAMGHDVSLVCRAGSRAPFARVIVRDPRLPLVRQIPEGTDVVHFQENVPDDFPLPWLVTCNGNVLHLSESKMRRAVFVSRNHAERFGAETYVHNGLDWSAYALPPRLPALSARSGFHFLGKAAWRVKNVRGAIRVALRASRSGRLEVLGGSRLNFRMGFRLTLSPRVRFHGMVGDSEKTRVILASRGLIFPVRWHEPFGLAVTESLYLGTPVFATPYGSLPELVTPEVGFLSADSAEMSAHIREHGGAYSPQLCHDYAAELFSARAMAGKYLKLYERVANGHPLNPRLLPPSAPGIIRLPWT